MTQDEIIEMAKEAGFMPTVLNHWPFEFERFAKLVADREREACAKIAFNSKTYIEAAKAIRARGQE